jgi:transposase/predicted transcriptional regulator
MNLEIIEHIWKHWYQMEFQYRTDDWITNIILVRYIQDFMLHSHQKIFQHLFYYKIILYNKMYSEDFKLLAKRLYSKLLSLRKVADLLNIHYSTVSKWLSCKKLPRKHIVKKLDNIEISNSIINFIKENPFASLKDIQSLLINNYELNISSELIRLFLKNNYYTKKKAKYYSSPSNLEEKTKEFIKLRTQYIKENRNFVSIDETSFGRNYASMYGYSLKGTKLHVKRLYSRITTESVLAASTLTEIFYTRSKVSFNSISFSNFIRASNFPAKSVILLDNVSFHHSKIVKEVAKQKNYDLLYVPPYSPIFNPIEGIFSIIKRNYYKCKSIQESLENILESHLTSFFRYSMNSITRF